jgi:hypothetical protein
MERQLRQFNFGREGTYSFAFSEKLQAKDFGRKPLNLHENDVDRTSGARKESTSAYALPSGLRCVA